jgi:hypothetical protein
MKNDAENILNSFFDPVIFQYVYLNQVPHMKQIEVLRSPHKNKIIVCGRRSGKSQMIAGELIRGAISKQYPKQILVAPSYKQAIIVFDKIIELMTQGGVYDDIHKIQQSPTPKITFKNFTTINFGSADNPDSLRGDYYDRVFKDESAFIKRGADNALKPLTYDKGAPVWETTTPMGKGEVWEKWLRGLNPKDDNDKNYGCFHYNYKDNPYLSEDGVKEIERDIEEYGESSVYVQCEIYGNFIEDRDVYFKRELVENCIDKEIVLGNVRHLSKKYYLGIDVAGEGEDESVFITIEYDGDILKIYDISYFEKNKPREIVGMVKMLDEKYNYNLIRIDKTAIGEGPEDWLKETLGGGLYDDMRVEGIRFSQTSKMDMYSNLKKIMNQGKLRIPNHRKLIFQLCDFRYEVTSNGLKLHHSEKGHDDYCDALALACWAVKDEGVIGYKPNIY